MIVTHWRTVSGEKLLISNMTEYHKENVAKMVSKKYGFRLKADNETLQEYLGQLLLWLEIVDSCNMTLENYCQ